MGRKRKYISQFKAKAAFEAAKGDKIISQIASEYGLHLFVHPFRYVCCLHPSPMLLRKRLVVVQIVYVP